jgi:hypothetical protein
MKNLKVRNTKTGKIRELTEVAVKYLKKHNQWVNLEILPDRLPEQPVYVQPAPEITPEPEPETDSEFEPVKRGRKPKTEIQ